ncbi:magnesium/cobalt transporter CorA [Echinicola sediminis]
MSRTGNTTPTNQLQASIELYSFGEDHFEKHHIKNPDDIPSFLNQTNKIWVNISNTSAIDTVNKVAEIFGIHPLIIEDIINTDQRPKIEEFENYIFLVTKMIYSKNGIKEISTEHLSILFGPNYILSFQETPKDVFDNIRSRLENPKGRMRKLGTDYFTYTLVDTVVDEYYTILELISDEIEKLEDRIIGHRNNISLSPIYHHRKALRNVRKSTWPIRELLANWKKSDHSLIKTKNLTYINDVYEHSIEILEGLELQREALSNLAEIYMTQLSIKQNEVMKTLTVMASIFIPLTFIAGVYGMNFQSMPELGWKYAYPILWGVFILVTASMIAYFKHKKWF